MFLKFQLTKFLQKGALASACFFKGQMLKIGQTHRFAPTGFLIFLILIPCFVNAQLLSPGELSKPHSHLVGLSNCTKCHKLGNEDLNPQCLDCHKKINFRIENKKGFHSTKNVIGENCSKCHSEHLGEDYNQIIWEGGKEKFDHSLTGYELIGKHKTEKCEVCHRKENIFDKDILESENKDLNKTMLGLNQNCLSCHFDEHRKQLPNDCRKCHNFESWKGKDNSFDHNNSKFKLTGKHKKTDCTKCHEIQKSSDKDKFAKVDSEFQKFVGLKFKSCNSCHEDIHKGKFKETCETCHSTQGWNLLKDGKSFDHSRTNFPLEGKHFKVECSECHKNRNFKTKLQFDKCSKCHTDLHFGDFEKSSSKGECEVCHTVNGWSPSTYGIEEHSKTDFPLKGGHLATPCIFCHKLIEEGKTTQRPQFIFAKFKCSNCHEDIHKGQFKEKIAKEDCQACHNENSWELPNFDHSETEFELTNSHTKTACNNCHKPIEIGTQNEKVLYKPIDSTCENCHLDIHFGQFKNSMKFVSGRKQSFTDCEKCHSTEEFKKTKFDHNKDAKFKLEGAHEKVECLACHKVEKHTSGKLFVSYKPLATDCKSCHGSVKMK